MLLGFSARPTAAQSAPAPGTLDPSFHLLARGGGGVQTVAVQPDGKVLVGGGFSDFNGVALQSLARLNADGSINASFQPNPGVAGGVSAIVVQPDGKILVGGEFQALDGIRRAYIGRLNADGTLDTGFAANSAPDNLVEGIALQPDGKVLIVGLFANVNGIPRNTVARLNADGSLDPSFDPGAGPEALTVNCIALQADGKVLLGGGIISVDGVPHNGFARLNTDGSLDTAYQGSLPSDDGLVYSIALQPDGKALVSGDLDIGGNTPVSILRFNTDGTLDTSYNAGSFYDPGSFNNNNGNAFGTVENVLALPGGGAVVIGQFTQVQGLARPRLVRLLANGSVDPAFAPPAGGFVGEQQASTAAVALQPDGKLFVGGSFVFVGESPSPGVARFNVDGGVDPGWQVGTGPGNASLGGVNVLTIQPDGKLLVGGFFSSINNLPCIDYARLNADGSIDPGFHPGTGAGTTSPLLYSTSGPQLNYVGTFSVQPDAKIIVGGYFNALDGLPRYNIGRLNPDGSADAGFLSPGGSVYATAVQPDGKVLLGGAFADPAPNLARLNADGSLDTGFNPGSSFTGVNALVVQPDGQILVGGDFGIDSYTGAAYGIGITRLNPDGSADATFNAGAGTNGNVSAIALQPDGRIVVGGGFSTVNNAPRGGVARLNTDGSLDTSFYPGVGADTDGVGGIILQPDGRLLVSGGFTAFAGAPRAGLARLNANGSLDYGFDPAPAFSGSGPGFALQSNGGILTNTSDGYEVVRLEGGLGHPLFFAGEQPVSSDFYYLVFPGGNVFGYYSDDFFPYLYHADLGFEYFIDAGDAAHGAYLYDFTSSTFFYTSPTFPFSYLYDFSLNAVLYYYPDPNNPGHYTTNPRYFYDFATGEIITK